MVAYLYSAFSFNPLAFTISLQSSFISLGSVSLGITIALKVVSLLRPVTFTVFSPRVDVSGSSTVKLSLVNGIVSSSHSEYFTFTS